MTPDDPLGVVPKRLPQPAQRALSNLGAMADKNPDQHAMALRIGDKVGGGFNVGLPMVKNSPQESGYIDKDYGAIIAARPRLAGWYDDVHNAAIGKDSVDALARTHDAIDALRNRGYLDHLKDAGEKGINQLDSSMIYLFASQGLMSAEQAGVALAGINKRQAELDLGTPGYVEQQQEAMQHGKQSLKSITERLDARMDEIRKSPMTGPGAIDRLESFKAIRDAAPELAIAVADLAMGWVSSPRAAGLDVVEQAANMTLPIAGGAIGTLANPGLGTAAGVFAGSSITEFGGWINEAVASRFAGSPEKMTDPAAITELLSDAQFMATVKGEAARKAIGTAGVDALFSFYAGTGITHAAGKGLRSQITAGAVELAEQSFGEFASEAAGQKFATGKVQWDEAVMEGLNSLGQSAGEIGFGGLMRGAFKSTGAGETAVKALQAVKDGRDLREASESLAAAPVAPRVPERTRQALEMMAGDGTLSVPVEAWDAAAKARGETPVEMLTGLVPDPATAYHEARGQGQVTFTTPAFVQAAAADLTLLDSLEADIRARPDGLTLREAKAELDEKAKQIEAVAAESADAELTAEEVEADDARMAEIEDEMGLPEGATTLVEPEATETPAAATETPAPAPATEDPTGNTPAAGKQGTLFQKGKGKEAAPGDPLRAAADAIEKAQPGLVGRIAGALTGATPVADAVKAATKGMPDGVVKSLAEAAQRNPAKTAENLREAADIQDRRAGKERPVSQLQRKMEAQIRAAGRTAREAKSVALVIARFVETMMARDPSLDIAYWNRVMPEFVRGVVDGLDGDALEQRNAGDQAKGAYDRTKRLIHVFDGANETTAIHEVSHWMTDMLGILAARPDAPPGIVKMYDDLVAAGGGKKGEPLTRDQHENIAEAFVAYLFKGEAPTLALRRAFATMRDIMLRVYEAVKAYIGEDKLSPEMRDVFDQMLATDAELEAAEMEIGVEGVPEDVLAKMEPELAAAVREAQQDAKDEARRTAFRDKMKAAADKRQAEREEAMEPLRAQARKELEQSPGNRALYALRDGTSPDGKPVPDADKISREDVEKAYGEQSPMLKALENLGVLSVARSTVSLLAKGGGIRLEAAAEAFGFGSGDELALAMTGAANMDVAVEKLAREMLALERPDLVGRNGLTPREARSKVASEARSRSLLEQLKALRSLATRERVAAEEKAGQEGAKTEQRRAAADRREAASFIPGLDFIRGEARRILAPAQIRNIRPSVYRAAALRESKASFKAARAGDFDAAARAKYRELLNHELYRESLALLKQAEAKQRRMVAYGSNAKQKVLGRAGWSYQDQMRALLARFNFALIPLERADELKALAEWVETDEVQRMKKGDDREANMPPRVLDQAFRKFWRDMTMDELADVAEAADRIYWLAASEDELFAYQRGVKLSESADRASRQALSTKAARKREHSGTETPKEERIRKTEARFGVLRKIASLAREMDAFKDGGVIWELLVLPINKALTRKATRMARDGEALLKIHELVGVNTPAFTEKRRIAGLSLSREDVLGIAELWGSEQGRDRVLNNFPGDTKPTVEQIQQILDTLTDKEIAYLEKKWAFWEQYWPEIVEQAKRLEGIAPEKVEHMPFRSAGRNLNGGYAHLAYTGTGTARLTASEEADILKRTSGARTQTRHGYEQSRAAGVRDDLVVRLDIGVGFAHLQEVIHDLSLREPLLDVQRLLRHKDVKDAIVSHHGQFVWDQFASAYADIAHAERGARDGFDEMIQKLRIGATAAVLALSLKTGIINLTGITQSMRRVGTGYVLRAASKWMFDAESMQNTIEMVYSRSAFMRSRSAELNQIISEDRARLGKRRQAWQEMRWLIIEKTQLAVDMPTWLGAYEKAIDEGAADDRAVDLADQAVRDAQGSGQAVDLSRIQRDPNPWKKLFTTFYFFDSTRLQQTTEAVQEWRGSKRDAAAWAKVSSDMTLLYAVPAALAVAITMAIAGDKGSDDPDEWIKEFAKENATYLLGLAPLLREGGGIVHGFRNYEGPPGLRLFSDAAKIANDLANENIESASQNAVSAAGSVFGLPAAQINRTWRGLSAIRRGRARGVRTITAPLFGPPRR